MCYIIVHVLIQSACACFGCTHTSHQIYFHNNLSEHVHLCDLVVLIDLIVNYISRSVACTDILGGRCSVKNKGTLCRVTSPKWARG